MESSTESEGNQEEGEIGKMRRILRSVAVPPSQHPNRYRASTLGWWFWCAERSRHYALNLMPDKEPTQQMKDGTELHEILAEKLGARFPWEDEFMDTIDRLQDSEFGFRRKFMTLNGDVDIYDNITGHPDDFQVSLGGEVSILEYKTTEINDKPKSMRFLERYRLPIAEFQLKNYCWIFEGILKKTDYRLARTHAVLLWRVHRKQERIELINVYPFTYYPKSVESDIRYAIEAYQKPEMIIPPRQWKCKQCPKIHKAICRFEQAKAKKAKKWKKEVK